MTATPREFDIVLYGAGGGGASGAGPATGAFGSKPTASGSA
ncbi:hypothetical protein [Mycobacterium sp. 1245499.0]|nr:hypothetical protein [Mycobacterium sp. 1245499.0]